MRSFPFVADGKGWSLPCNFATLLGVAERVGDPFDLLMRWSTLQKGETMLTAIQTVDTLCIGLHAAGCTKTRPELANEFINRGLLALAEDAAAYITLMATASTDAEEVDEGKKKKRPGNGAGAGP